MHKNLMTIIISKSITTTNKSCTNQFPHIYIFGKKKENKAQRYAAGRRLLAELPPPAWTHRSRRHPPRPSRAAAAAGASRPRLSPEPARSGPRLPPEAARDSRAGAAGPGHFSCGSPGTRPRRRPRLRRCLVAAHRPAPARRRTGPRQRRLAGQVEEVAGVMRTRGCGLATESHRLVGGEHWTCLLSRLRPRPARVGATPHCPTGRKPGNARSRSDAGDCGPIRWPCG